MYYYPLNLRLSKVKYEDFFTLFAKGDVELFNRVYQSKLRQHLNEDSRQFFDATGSHFFHKSCGEVCQDVQHKT